MKHHEKPLPASKSAPCDSKTCQLGARMPRPGLDRTVVAFGCSVKQRRKAWRMASSALKMTLAMHSKPINGPSSRSFNVSMLHCFILHSF